MSVDREKGTQRDGVQLAGSGLEKLERLGGADWGPSRQGWNLKRSTYHICLAHDLAGYAAIVREPANINGDPAFTANVSELERYYLTDAAAADVLNRIRDNATFPVAYYDPANYTVLEDHGTSHWPRSIRRERPSRSRLRYRGSQGMMTDGVILNNEMDDFSASGQRNAFGFAPSPINFIRTGKRLQSSIASSIAEDLETGEVTIVTGSAGGSRIITATMQELHHFIDQGIGAAECTRHPRWHDQLGGLTYFEIKNDALGIAGFDNATVAYMKALGYNTTYEDLSGSTSHELSTGLYSHRGMTKTVEVEVTSTSTTPWNPSRRGSFFYFHP
ncbi:gamma-glutamyltranspeptidase-domain-containing protein [Mycena vulgaris]|nr:gamma-glutamyltranspeptidase-domain-containing protein [Mycena vulgaris]